MILKLIFSVSLLYFVAGDLRHPTIDLNIIQEVFPTPVENEDKEYWNEVGLDEVIMALNQSQHNENVAKNVILFIGDGFGFQTITATRIYKGQQFGQSGEEAILTFDEFPHIGFSKTYNVDAQVPDSAGTATAYLSGVKTNMGVVGYDCNVKRGQCETMLEEYKVSSIAQWSQDGEKRTGFVTTMRLTDATPSAIYAHVAEREWEVDSKLPQDWNTTCPGLKDIAAQLIDNQAGQDLNVIMGGGFQAFTPDSVSTEDDPVSGYLSPRVDGRYLSDEWLSNKLNQQQQAALIRTRTQLMALNTDNTDFLMGIFANDNLPYENLIREHNYDVPTLKEMTEAAINVLDKGFNGYFLLVEGGKIDWAHHEGMANTALDEAYAFEKAIEGALEMVDLENTLVIVTADHTHTMSVAGYPPRGTIISGLAYIGDDDLPFTTLLYGTGPGYNYTVKNGEVTRPDPSTANSADFDYRQQSAVPRDLESHGGDDVPIFAKGPWAHLFYTVHEQNFIATVMAYASCVGTDLNHCKAGSK